ncbi:MAG: hypothetical protein WC028_29925 [Candidatus Obscuribacterales bacterium]|jgi:hypothetical protein
MTYRIILKAFVSGSIASLLISTPCFCRDSRAVWFNQYDMPEHCSAKLLSKDYALNAVFTRYYENLEIPTNKSQNGSVAFKVDPHSGKLFPWYYDGDESPTQTLCTIFDAAALSGPVKIPQNERLWFVKHGLNANFHFDTVPRLRSGVDSYRAIESARWFLPIERQGDAVIRAIPKQILEYYPDLFTIDELNSPTNFRIIDKKWVKLHSITSLREEWINHFADSTFKPTKQDLIYIRDQVDRKCRKAITPLPTQIPLEGRTEGPRNLEIFKLAPTVLPCINQSRRY